MAEHRLWFARAATTLGDALRVDRPPCDMEGEGGRFGVLRGLRARGCVLSAGRRRVLCFF
jgi:hypothetical protein